MDQEKLFNKVNKVNRGLEAFRKKIESMDWQKINNTMTCFLYGLYKMPDMIESIHKRLAVNGWYLLTAINLKELVGIVDGTPSEIDNIMCSYIEKNYEILVNEIIETFPNRAEIINDSLQARLEGKYNLSVPILLMQADGISFEMFNKSAFTKHGNEPLTKKAKYKYISKNIDSTDFEYTLYVLPLDLITSMSMSTANRDKIDEDLINRHGIIHGIDINYGNLINSYKGIVLLKYLADIKNRYINSIDVKYQLDI